MGIEQFDFLYQQAQIMLSYLASVNDGLTSVSAEATTISDNLTSVDASLSDINSSMDTITAYLNAGDYANALSTIANVKTVVDSTKSIIEGNITTIPATVDATKGTLATINTLVNSLIPLITVEIEKIAGDQKTFYRYECTGCSLKCEGKWKFIPPGSKGLKYCRLKEDSSANYQQREVIRES